MNFFNRTDAGKKLAAELQQYKNATETIIIGLPRGGVVTAHVLAQELNLPVDIIVTRKIGAPSNEELAVGALTQEGGVIWNEDVMRSQHLTPEDVKLTVQKEKTEVARRIFTYRGNKPPLNLTNKIVILTDDGIATGATMRAAIASARACGAAKIIVAVPVAPIDAMERITNEVDNFTCVHLAKTFMGIGSFYKNFDQVTDEEVIALLAPKK